MRSIDRPNQYQFAAWDAENNLIHAGVHGAARIDIRAAIKAQRDWLAWRVIDVPRTRIPKCTRMMIQPIGKPEETKVFAI